MTAVVLVGDFPSTGIIGDTVATRVPDSSAPQDSLAFLDLAAYGLNQHGAVLVLFPAWRPEATTRLVRMARGLFATDRIAAVPLALPPLALSVVADQLAFMAPHVRPGVLASLAPALAIRVYAGAWVNSVAKLEHIQAGLGQHVYSYMPGSGFMVAAAPEPAVHRITSSAPVAEPTFRPQDPVLVLAAQEHGDAAWVRDRLGPSLRAVSLTFLNPPPLGTRYWATKKYAEFVAFSGHPQDLQQVIQSTPCTPCPWCEEPTAQPICPFCARVQDRTDPAPPETPITAGYEPPPSAPQSTQSHAQPRSHAPPPLEPVLSAPPPQAVVFPPQHPPPAPTTNGSSPPARPAPSETEAEPRPAHPTAEHNGQVVDPPMFDDRASDDHASDDRVPDDRVPGHGSSLHDRDEDGLDEGRPGSVGFRAGRPY